MISIEELFEQLMKNVQESDSFYYKDFINEDGCLYRIFDYRLASYNNFLLPYAREMRGITFRLDQEENPIKLVSLPFHKFFNLYENPFTEGINLKDSIFFTDKEDGSLITTYFDCNDELQVKTKASFESEQAIETKQIIENNIELKRDLETLEELGFTVIMEYVSPDNRIVLHYPESDLRILMLRSREDFKYYLPFLYVQKDFVSEEFGNRIVNFNYESIKNHEDFVEETRNETHKEGYVIAFDDENRGIEFVKLKTDWYQFRHKLKETIANERKIYEAIINEDVDDLKITFHDDASVLREIEEKENKIIPKYNALVQTIESFYERNKDKDRKDYAIQTKEELGERLLGLTMPLYTGGQPDYKKFVMKNLDSILNEEIV